MGQLTRFNFEETRFMSTLYYEYLLSLGNFEIDHLTESVDMPYPMILFIISTTLVQIVILNMLIAIMGDTYDKVQDQLQETILMERINIMAEYLPTTGYLAQNCMFIIKPISMETDEVDWTGRLKLIKDQYNKTSGKQLNFITHKIY